jgi:chemotaxis response regulator CheB
MPIQVLIADDTEIMREAMRKVIEQEPGIKVVGEASSFGQTMQAIADCKPDVLLLDLHLAEKRDFSRSLVKSQLVSVENTLAVSFSNERKGVCAILSARLDIAVCGSWHKSDRPVHAKPSFGFWMRRYSSLARSRRRSLAKPQLHSSPVASPSPSRPAASFTEISVQALGCRGQN